MRPNEELLIEYQEIIFQFETYLFAFFTIIYLLLGIYYAKKKGISNKKLYFYTIIVIGLKFLLEFILQYFQEQPVLQISADIFFIIGNGALLFIIPYFFNSIFKFNRSVILYISTTVLGLAIMLLDSAHPYFFLRALPFIYLSWLLYKSMKNKAEGAYHALFGVVFFMFFFFAGYIGEYTDAGIFIFLFFISMEQTLKLSRDKNEHKIRALKLEGELLRKIIQPHYLLNSLNALLEWLEVNPVKGTELIGALTTEFKLVTEFSKKEFVDINEEIELCRTHLKVMSLRNDCTYQIKVKGYDKNLSFSIPPAILLTLTENGITYISISNSDVIFHLQIDYSSDNEEVKIIFETPFNSNKKISKIATGTGYNYIKSRLTECYDENWRLDNNISGDLYQTVITFKRKYEGSYD